MNLIKKIKEKLFTEDGSTMAMKISNEILGHPDLLEFNTVDRLAHWTRHEFIFDEPVKLYFVLHYVSGDEEYFFFEVHKLVLVEYLNIFVDCRVSSVSSQGVEKFFILNDVSSVGFSLELDETGD